MYGTCAERNTWTWKAQRFIQPVQNRLIGDDCRFRSAWINIEEAGCSQVNHELTLLAEDWSELRAHSGVPNACGICDQIDSAVVDECIILLRHVRCCISLLGIKSYFLHATTSYLCSKRNIARVY